MILLLKKLTYIFKSNFSLPLTLQSFFFILHYHGFILPQKLGGRLKKTNVSTMKHFSIIIFAQAFFSKVKTLFWFYFRKISSFKEDINMILNREKRTLNSSKDKRSLADQSRFSCLCHKNSSFLLLNKSYVV